MGMFSYRCRGCEHPLLSRYATNYINDWMENTVVLAPDDGVVAAGIYDGYGNVVDVDHPGLDSGDTDGGYQLTYNRDTGDCMEAVWHYACWKRAGEPAFDKPSTNAPDQGYFFAQGAHDMLNPLEAN